MFELLFGAVGLWVALDMYSKADVWLAVATTLASLMIISIGGYGLNAGCAVTVFSPIPFECFSRNSK